MKKEIRTVDADRGVVQVTIADERFYSRQGTNKDTGLPEIQWVPSVTWIAGHYPKGISFFRWLADKGWDEAEAIKAAAGDKGSRVHHAIVDLLDGHTVAMDAKYAAGDEPAQELSLEEYDCLRAFGDFWQACEPETLAREVTVFSAEHNYAGTLDWVGLLHNPPKGVSRGPWILDWKTSKDVWPEHELQVSGYAHSDWITDLTIDMMPTIAKGQPFQWHLGDPGGKADLPAPALMRHAGLRRVYLRLGCMARLRAGPLGPGPHKGDTMKRVITVKAEGVTIVATIETNGHQLVRDQVEEVRDQLADRLQEAAAGLRYIGVPRNRVRVK